MSAQESLFASVALPRAACPTGAFVKDAIGKARERLDQALSRESGRPAGLFGCGRRLSRRGGRRLPMRRGVRPEEAQTSGGRLVGAAD